MLAKTAAAAARADGVEIFSIGVGGTYNLQNFKDMASTPHSNHVYELSTFDVAQFKAQLLTTICTQATGGNNNSGASSGTRYVNKYAVNYNCDDGIVYPSGDARGTTPNPANKADQKTRYVRVEHCNGLDCAGKQHQLGFIDWDKLSVGSSWINWIKDTKAGHGGDDQAKWNGASCSDSCDTSPTLVATLHYGGDCTGNLVECKVAGCQRQKGDLRNFPEFRA